MVWEQSVSKLESRNRSEELKQKIYRSLKHSIEIERQRANVIKQSSKDDTP